MADESGGKRSLTPTRLHQRRSLATVATKYQRRAFMRKQRWFTSARGRRVWIIFPRGTREWCAPNDCPRKRRCAFSPPLFLFLHFSDRAVTVRRWRYFYRISMRLIVVRDYISLFVISTYLRQRKYWPGSHESCLVLFVCYNFITWLYNAKAHERKIKLTKQENGSSRT